MDCDAHSALDVLPGDAQDLQNAERCSRFYVIDDGAVPYWLDLEFLQNSAPISIERIAILTGMPFAACLK